MTRKIFQSILLVAGTVLAASLVVIMGCLYRYFGVVQEERLQDELQLAAAVVEQGGTDQLQDADSEGDRFTWIAGDGSVLFDSKVDASALENHGGRVEVQEALQDGQAKCVRYSSTLLEKTMYYAQKLDDGTVLRISASQDTVGGLLLGMLQPILAVLAMALILSGVLASRLSKRIVEPLNKLDLDHPLDNEAYEEVAPLLNRIHRQHQQINDQLRELNQRTEEFDQITSSMAEGLLLLDGRGRILSLNPAAQRFFETEENCVGADFLTIDRTSELSEAVSRAQTEGHSEFKSERRGRICQFDLSRIDTEEEPAGVVVLVFDITEKEQAEQSRREFTANVSHELKTPLQGIIGSAELLECGMVKEEDIPRFVGHIRTEAQRLVTLIRDIIQLSQLDEGDEMPREPVELLSLCRQTAQDLTDAAAEKSVTVTAEGEEVTVNGVRRLLSAVVFNLCDNAVKYNRTGGTVTLHTERTEHAAIITVTDTGIGIPPEHQDRIFERFYRVDKSHSKSTGGTGLGLSIVKHAVRFHHGTITLHSIVGAGTEIRVELPLES